MRWIAYTSDESGRFEIYVRPFVASGPSSARTDQVPITVVLNWPAQLKK